MKRILSLLLVLCLAFSLFAGCAKKEPASEPSGPEESQEEAIDVSGKKVAICMGSVNHPVHRVIQYSFLTKAEELGMEAIISGLDEGSIQDLIYTWETDIAQNNISGIALWSGDDSCYDMMKGLKEEGVYCVLPHFSHNYEDTKDFIDRNICTVGEKYIREAVRFIVDELQSRGIENGTIGYTANGPAAMYPYEYRKIMIEELQNLGTAYTVPDVVFEGAEIIEATNKVTSVIQGNEDIVGGIGITGGSAQSWKNAMENTDRTDLVVVAMDCTATNIEILDQGYVTGIIYQPLHPEMQECAQTLYDLFGGTVYNQSEDTWFKEMESPIVTKDGEGICGIDFHKQLLSSAEAYFK